MASEDKLDRGTSVPAAAYDATKACRHRGNNYNYNDISVQPLNCSFRIDGTFMTGGSNGYILQIDKAKDEFVQPFFL